VDALNERLSDEALVARLRDNDTAAFTILYDRHRRLAFGLAYRLLDNAAAAEDVVQDAFLSLWRNAGAFQPQRSTARAWLLSMVHHRAIDQLRKIRSHRVQGGQEVKESKRIGQSIDIHEEACVALEAAEVRDALATLPHEQRQTLALQYFSGLSHREIARRLAIPLGTVKSRQHTALLKLRITLSNVGTFQVRHGSGCPSSSCVARQTRMWSEAGHMMPLPRAKPRRSLAVPRGLLADQP
jgi:RNA polymerase sigma-70 factor (ECF subfamily)